jgi:CheY-like chemotaxis protein
MELPSETPLIPIQRDYLNKASIASRSLLGIINDILDFSRIESGHFQIGSFPFDPAALVLETVSLFETTLVDRGLLLDIHLDERMPSPLIGDPERIMQVLRNLLVNAVKFTCEGGITVSTRLESRDENGVVVEYSVVDTGIGIDIENVDALFEPFLQADSSISRRFGGTGLGLTICSRLVSAMDGSIRVESVPGGGSCFHFRLPLGLAGESVGALEPVLTGAVDISGSRVLLVEDVETIREITRLFLQGMGIDPEEASNGAEAVEKGCTGEFDLILMDVQMPGMDGLEATRELRERGVSAPVIAMTAHALARHHQECMESGMIDILTKPFSREELRTMLVRWLRAPGRSGLS